MLYLIDKKKAEKTGWEIRKVGSQVATLIEKKLASYYITNEKVVISPLKLLKFLYFALIFYYVQV